jgi:protein TonB
MEAKKKSDKQLAPKRSLFLSTGLCLSLFIVFSAFQIKTKATAPTILADFSLEEYPFIIEIEHPRFEEPQPPIQQPPEVITIIDDPLDYIEVDEPTIEIPTKEPTVEVLTFVEPPEEMASEPEEFIIVEELASFPGGMEYWNKYLRKNLRYPRQAQRMGIEGKVQLSFYVDVAGNISDIQVTRGIGGGCDKEAIRVLKNSPNWKPGLQRGNPVKSPMSIFIKFRLK